MSEETRTVVNDWSRRWNIEVEDAQEFYDTERNEWVLINSRYAIRLDDYI